MEVAFNWLACCVDTVMVVEAFCVESIACPRSLEASKGRAPRSLQTNVGRGRRRVVSCWTFRVCGIVRQPLVIPSEGRRGEALRGSAVTPCWCVTPEEMPGLAFLESVSAWWSGCTSRQNAVAGRDQAGLPVQGAVSTSHLTDKDTGPEGD